MNNAKAIYHYAGETRRENVLHTNGRTFAIRNTNGTFVVWRGPTRRDGHDKTGPVVFASVDAAQVWLGDMAEAMPDGHYRVIEIEPAALLAVTASVLPSVFWTRIDGSFAFVSLPSLLIP